MASSNMSAPAVQVVGFEIPPSGNPFRFVQEQLVLQMYPPFPSGFRARVITLLVVLSAIIVLSALYLGVQYVEARRRGRDFWLWRVVERPAGRYLVMNQYVAYPSVSIVLGALWIAYTTFLYRMFGGAHADPKPLYFWIPVLWIPFYLSMSTTTFSVLSGANLVSKGRKPNTHRLGPWTANGLLVLLPLAMVVAISCAVGYTGMKWRNFGRSWEAAHAGIGVLADQWTGSYDAAAEAVANQLVKTRMERYCEFEISQTICTAIYCLSAAVLILINLIGGLYLLATLRALGNHQRVVPQHTPLVAPLQPFKTGPSPLYVPEEGSNGSATLASPDPEQQKRRGSAGSEAWGKQASAPSAGLKKLQWDVTLFFLAVVPMSLLFMGWSIFASRNFVLVLTRPGLYEFNTIGIVYIYSLISVLSLAALTTKTALSLYSSRTRPTTSLSDDTVAANLRRRAQKGYSTGAVSGVAVQVVEWQEVESVYEDEWTGESRTKASLYPTEMEDLESTWESRSRRR